VVDKSSDGSRAKAAVIENALRVSGKVERLSLTPVQTEVDEAEAYHPALLVRGLLLAGRSEEDVHAALRSALYTGAAVAGASGSSNDSVEGASGSSDRFSLARHGLLESF
jgi:hypothetical protein